MSKLFGKTEPRIWTPPLRELTSETSLGFEVIEFAALVLGVTLYPWQQWLLIHALELLPNGEYRFRRIVVLVARQQGKTTLASVLAAWWLFVDSDRHPTRVPPIKFKVVGVAQNLDIAREPWSAVKSWCDPKPDTMEEAELAIDDLQDATAKVVDTNGKESIVARSRAHYEIRAAKNARGKPAARVLMDEGREQRDHQAWNAVSQTTKSFFNGQLWLISNAGDAGAVVLRQQRDAALEDRAAWTEHVESGLQRIEEYANGRDVSLGIFEWSAPDGCAKDDVEGILQANPSIGYGAMTVQSALADIRGMTDAGYRTEVLCQWVTARVENYIDVDDWQGLQESIEDVVSSIPKGARTVWAVDMSHDRRTTWIGAAVLTEYGDPFVTVRWKSAGWAWLIPYLIELAQKSGQREVALQIRGVPAMEFLSPLNDARFEIDGREVGFIVHGFDWPTFALATGRFSDKVRDGELVTTLQPDIDIAIEGGVTTKLAENVGWSRAKSFPVDIAGLCAMTMAVYALEEFEPDEPEPDPIMPPPAATVPRGEVETADFDIRSVAF